MVNRMNCEMYLQLNTMKRNWLLSESVSTIVCLTTTIYLNVNLLCLDMMKKRTVFLVMRR